jgi:ATP-dependent DNA helicase RecG
MTATPIPRTLALTLYGDLDISLLDEIPKGRKKIITKIVAPANRGKAYQFIKEQIKKDRQVFVICPLIEESEKLQTKAVLQEYEKLKKEIFPEFRIAVLHGKLKEKQKIMKDFALGKIDILVATSVVEVGIDVKNATVIMIEGAERFGLAQLHQLRGRVGRGKYQSYCFLFTESSSKRTAQRLKALLECESGFKLAEMDLKIRGPGQFLGTRQWGMPDLSMASLKDLKLIQAAREEAKRILPELSQYPLLEKKLNQFAQTIHFE